MSDPLLLTPGPLTTAAQTRAAMARDVGSREADFLAVVDRVRRRLLDVVGADDEWSTVLLQGSGTFAMEAAVGTLVSSSERLLVLVNGAYGRRIAEIARRLGIDVVELCFDELAPVDVAAVDRALHEDDRIGHVALVHCETTSGLLNPLAAVEEVVRRHGCRLIVDAMSSVGALPVVATGSVEVIVASANKALEAVPGIAFAVCRKEALQRTAGQARSWSLDLSAQWQRLERDGQFRTTPPTQVLLALDHALQLLDDEGGPPARRARYEANRDALVEGLRSLGLRPLVAEALQSPIIVSIAPPAGWEIASLHAALLQRGFAIYPGKLTDTPSFRVGCIGQVSPVDIRRFVAALDEVIGG